MEPLGARKKRNIFLDGIYKILFESYWLMKLPKIQFKFEPTLQDMSEQFICARCKSNFPQEELKAPPLFLQIFAFPLYLKSLQTAKEARFKYCPKCRRSVNASLFFVAFFITIIVIFLVIKKFSNN